MEYRFDDLPICRILAFCDGYCEDSYAENYERRTNPRPRRLLSWNYNSFRQFRSMQQIFRIPSRPAASDFAFARDNFHSKPVGRDVQQFAAPGSAYRFHVSRSPPGPWQRNHVAKGLPIPSQGPGSRLRKI